VVLFQHAQRVCCFAYANSLRSQRVSCNLRTRKCANETCHFICEERTASLCLRRSCLSPFVAPSAAGDALLGFFILFSFAGYTQKLALQWCRPAKYQRATNSTTHHYKAAQLLCIKQSSILSTAVVRAGDGGACTVGNMHSDGNKHHVLFTYVSHSRKSQMTRAWMAKLWEGSIQRNRNVKQACSF